MPTTGPPMATEKKITTFVTWGENYMGEKRRPIEGGYPLNLPLSASAFILLVVLENFLARR